MPGYPTKICQFCLQPIPLDAMVCKFCTRDVNTDEEVGELIRNYFKQVVKQHEERNQRAKVIGIFIIGVLILGWLGSLLARH